MITKPVQRQSDQNSCSYICRSTYIRNNDLLESTPVPYAQETSQQYAVHLNRFSALGQFESAELIRNMITKPVRRQSDQNSCSYICRSTYIRNNDLLESTPVPYAQETSQQYAVHLNRFSALGQFESAELIRNMITKPVRRQSDQNSCSYICRSTYIRNNDLLESTPVPYAQETSQVEE